MTDSDVFFADAIIEISKIIELWKYFEKTAKKTYNFSFLT